MKGWAREAEKQRRSNSAVRQFRQLITKLGEGFPNGHYLAYCVCSKQSSHGVFLNERLIAIDTFNKQIKYYSHVPRLPLSSMRELPPSTQTLKITSEVEFVVERVRVGHIRISWEEGGQQRLWKFIMSSNQVALQFQQLFVQLQQNTFLKSNAQINNVQASFDRAIAKKQVSVLKNSQANDVLQKMSSQNIENTSRFDRQSQKINISLVRSDKIREEVTDYFNHHYKLQVSPPPQKKQQKLQAGMAMFNQWMLAQDPNQRSNIYHKFIERCKKKVETFMENFISSHLLHEQRNGLCMIKDNQVEIYYCPYYTGQQEGYDELLECVHKQEEMIAEWETLNYLAKFKRVKDYRVSVPMLCLITYKSFKFYCKSSCEYYTQRKKIDVYFDFHEQLTILQNQSHLKIRNQRQQIYLLNGLPQKIILISTANCLPILPPKTPISARYVQLFITSGVISNSKDLQAISTHITGKLTQKIKHNIVDHQFSNPCQMMDYITVSGFSHHFLPCIMKQTQKQQNTRKVIASALIAKVMEWELRKRMQGQLFKKRQFGFAFNQFRIGINLLLQKDPYFLKVIQGIFRTFYDYYTESLDNLDSLTDVTGFLLTLFNNLGFSCKAHLPYEYDHQIWSQKYINDSLQLDAQPSINYMIFDLFSNSEQFLKTQLISQTNFELIGQDKFQQALTCLNISKQLNGSYSLSGRYQIMPKDIKETVNFYLSHFIPPNVVSNKVSLQSEIYSSSSFYVRRQEYLITLNRLRWLARMKYYEMLEKQLMVESEKAIVWGDLAYLIELYSLQSKLCRRKGDINRGLQLALRALQYCLQLYDERPNSSAELLIAQHAFQAANFHYDVHRFSKALDLYSTTEDILSNIRSGGSKASLNPYFMLIFVNKCSIYLLFGEYQECISQAASALKSCKKFGENGDSSVVLDYELKIYAIMCKVYLIKNMRRQILDLGSFCCIRFLEESMIAGEQLQIDRIREVLKLAWIGVIKGVELVSTALHFGQPIQKQLKTIYLKKVRQQLKNLRQQLNNTHRYQIVDVCTLLTRKVKSVHSKGQSAITSILIKCLSNASLNPKTARSSGIHSKQSLSDDWLFLQGLTVMIDYDYLIGSIEDSLHLYDYQY